MGETERNDEDVVIPERAHDQPAEGGREQADQAAAGDPEGDGADDETGGAAG